MKTGTTDSTVERWAGKPAPFFIGQRHMEVLLEILAKLPAEKDKTVKGALLMDPAPFRFIQIVPI